MKKGIWAAAILILICGIAYAASYPIATGTPEPGIGWVLTASDDDIDTTAELVTELDTTFVQLAAADTIYAVSSDAGDTSQTLYVSGVDNTTGRYTYETFSLNGTTPTGESSTTFRYIDQTWVDIECAGTVSVNRYDAGATLINSIEIGSLKGDIGHHFNGTYTTYLREWWATSATTDATTVELRWYPDDADCLDAGDGFVLIDKMYMAAGVYMAGPNSLYGTKLPAGGWLAIYGTGGVNNQEVTVTVIGQDSVR